MAVALVLAACGGGAADELTEAQDEFSELIEEMEGILESAEHLPEESDDSGTFVQEILPPGVPSPDLTDPPAGYARIPAMCESDGKGARVPTPRLTTGRITPRAAAGPDRCAGQPEPGLRVAW